MAGCSGGNKGSQQSKTHITVSIEPLRWVVSSLVDDNGTEVAALVPAGAAPETFEPTAKQLQELSNSAAYLSLELLDFEKVLASRIRSTMDGVATKNLSHGANLMEGSCSHSHSSDHAGHNHSECSHSHGHSHGGIDPHIWLSVQEMRMIVKNSAQILDSLGLLKSGAEDSLLNVISTVENDIETIARQSDVKAFGIGHPSLSYFARDFGLEQIALEHEGKEPGAAMLVSTTNKMHEANVATILYNTHESDGTVRAVAREFGIEPTSFSPQPAQWDEAMINLAKIIYGTPAQR